GAVALVVAGVRAADHRLDPAGASTARSAPGSVGVQEASSARMAHTSVARAARAREGEWASTRTRHPASVDWRGGRTSRGANRAGRAKWILTNAWPSPQGISDRVAAAAVAQRVAGFDLAGFG